MQNIFLRNWMFRIKDVLMSNDDLKDDMEIVLYKGYGNSTTVFVSGMVIAGKNVQSFSNNSKWENMRAMIKRFTRKTVANQEVKIDLLSEQTKVITDGSGSFSVQLKLPCFHKVQSDRWIPVKAIIPNTSVKVTGQIQIINDDEERIFISDIDDTVLISHSTHLFRKLYLILFKNAESRLPFPDIPRFYQQLKSGRSNNADHPFFYVSSSEWNLYDLLNDFFKFNQIPEGTLLLKKYSEGIIKLWLSGKKHHDLKYNKIRFLLTFYPYQKFVLLGDNGQEDPIIYGRLTKEFPGRIETVYIRQIKSLWGGKTNEVDSLFDTHTHLIQIKHTKEAFNHAKVLGYI
nr:phosphatase domain-containing protein [uncultured Carboxylicivirga sp.]